MLIENVLKNEPLHALFKNTNFI